MPPAGPDAADGRFGPRADPRGAAGYRPGPGDGDAEDRRSARAGSRSGARLRGRGAPGPGPESGSWPAFEAAPLAADRTGPRTIPPPGQALEDDGYEPVRTGVPEPGERSGRRGSRSRREQDGESGRGPAVSRGEAAESRSARRGQAAGRTRRPGGNARQNRLLIWGGAGAAVAVILIVVVVLSMLGPGGPKHSLSTPGTIGQFVRRPQLEQQMNATQLQQQVIKGSAGQASHVRSAVYENSAGISGKATPQIFLFIGGNLSGTTASDFITSFRGQFQGATLTNAGALGGEAVCVNAQSGMPGTVALCAWADDDTFGVLASPTMHAAQLGSEMRLIRPGVEHVVK